jgi:hypothetical protein
MDATGNLKCCERIEQVYDERGNGAFERNVQSHEVLCGNTEPWVIAETEYEVGWKPQL